MVNVVGFKAKGFNEADITASASQIEIEVRELLDKYNMRKIMSLDGTLGTTTSKIMIGEIEGSAGVMLSIAYTNGIEIIIDQERKENFCCIIDFLNPSKSNPFYIELWEEMKKLVNKHNWSY